jgi:hypothetical protein
MKGVKHPLESAPWVCKHLSITHTNNLPPVFFKVKSTDQVFATLNNRVVRRTIDFNDDLEIQEGEVHYEPRTEEWVLGPIRLPVASYHALQGYLGGGPIRVQTRPISKKHGMLVEGDERPAKRFRVIEIVPESWGPELP